MFEGLCLWSLKISSCLEGSNVIEASTNYCKKRPLVVLCIQSVLLTRNWHLWKIRLGSCRLWLKCWDDQGHNFQIILTFLFNRLSLLKKEMDVCSMLVVMRSIIKIWCEYHKQNMWLIHGTQPIKAEKNSLSLN